MIRRELVLGTGALAIAAAVPLRAGPLRSDPLPAGPLRPDPPRAGPEAGVIVSGEPVARLQASSPGTDLSLLRELVNAAILAPSSHNTQCWKFALQDRQIRISADVSRRCAVVDPDEHHSFVSLGCAAQNLSQAALANGLRADAQFDESDSTLLVHLEATKPHASDLFQVIAQRQCTRGDYDGKALSPGELRLLEQAGTGDGVRIELVTARPAMERVLSYVVEANTLQMDNPLFIAELKKWLRFSQQEAISSGDGLFTGASGNPVVPRWLGLLMLDVFYTAHSENARYARQVRNSAGLALFVSERSDRAHWLEAGRCYERFALQATALGVRNALLNQPVEVASIRPQFAAALGLGQHRPDLVVRFGRGPAMPMSRRRPLQAVLVA